MKAMSDFTPIEEPQLFICDHAEECGLECAEKKPHKRMWGCGTRCGFTGGIPDSKCIPYVDPKKEKPQECRYSGTCYGALSQYDLCGACAWFEAHSYAERLAMLLHFECYPDPEMAAKTLWFTKHKAGQPPKPEEEWHKAIIRSSVPGQPEYLEDREVEIRWVK